MVKILIKKLAIITTIVILLSLAIDIFLPYGWADIVQYTKIKHYQKNKEKYNALFFGGSLEYRHIMPSIIDENLKEIDIKFKSYNLGVDAHNIIQQISDIEGVLKIKNNNLKYVFVSLSSEPYFFAYNKNTSKWLAWNNAKSTYRALSILPNAGKAWKERFRFMYLYIRSWIMNIFKVGMLPDVLSHIFVADTLHQAYIGTQQDGFFSYDEERQYLAKFNKGLDEPLIASRSSFVNTPQHRDSLLKGNIQQFNNYKKTDIANKQELKMLQNLIQNLAKKGIDVYFILPPRARTTYSFLLPIYYALPPERCIDVANPLQYPAFYAYENGYNFHHLNLKGAKIYSNVLSEKIATLLKQNSTTVE
jgi:hypothetical protein